METTDNLIGSEDVKIKINLTIKSDPHPIISDIAEATKIQLIELIRKKNPEKLYKNKSKNKPVYLDLAMDIYNVTQEQINHYRVEKEKEKEKEMKKDNRNKNGTIEALRLKKLVELYNNDFEYKSHIDKSCGTVFDKFELSGGRHNKHDLIGITSNEKNTIEVKGHTNICNEKPKSLKLWKFTPQLVNCSGKDLKEIFSIYAEFYYNQLHKYKNIWTDLPDIPTKEEYIIKDLGPGSAGTDFSKALKEKKNNETAAYLEIFENLHKTATSLILDKLNSNLDLKNKLCILIQDQMITALNNKNLWFNIYYKECDQITPNINDIVCYVTPKIKNLKIQSISNEPATKQRCFDLKIKTSYDLECNDITENCSGETRLRWSNGKGISNLMWKID